MRRWLLYHYLTWLDIIRLWPSVQHHVIIVAGICLPILLLLGLKNGHVAALRYDLVRSPTGREIVIWIANRGDMLTQHNLLEYQNEIHGIDLIIPSVQRIVKITNSRTNGDKVIVDAVTLLSTTQRDPILNQYGADVLDETEASDKIIILAKNMALDLSVTVGEQVTVEVFRSRESVKESATLEMTVGGLVEAGEKETSNIAYASVNTLLAMERYVMGYQVPKFGWPAINAAAPDTYAGYLLFAKKGDDLSQQDSQALDERGYKVIRVEERETRLLYGLLRQESLDDLLVYYVTRKHATDAPWGTCHDSPRDLTRVTKPDDVAIPWNAVKQVTLSGNQYRAIGVSLPQITWLKQHMIDPQLSFSYTDSTFLTTLPNSHAVDDELILQLADGLTIPLSVRPTIADPTIDEGQQTQPQSSPLQDPTSHEHSIVVFPTDLLSYLYAFESQKVQFDAINKLFVAVPSEPTFPKARLYATTIDEVPSVVDAFKKRGYAALSETTRINEIHKQSHSLSLLVIIVGIGVFLFGVVTVISVLLDSTERKRGTLGILRVMGVSRLGIFYTVFLRATLIACFAALVTIVVGYGIAIFLSWRPPTGEVWASWKPVIQVIILPTDLLVVVAGALACCGLGSLVPAQRASRLDPFDAIVEGRFR